MLDFFVIFSKSGIVLFATVQGPITRMVNGLIKHIIEEQLQQYQADRLQLKYKMDNEFELVFVAGYQKMLSLSYVDKFLDDIQLAFRDKFSDFDLRRIANGTYKGQQQSKRKMASMSSAAGNELARIDNLVIDVYNNIIDFNLEFKTIYKDCIATYSNIPKQGPMRTFQNSSKSKKTVSSMFVQQATSHNNVTPVAAVAAVTANNNNNINKQGNIINSVNNHKKLSDVKEEEIQQQENRQNMTAKQQNKELATSNKVPPSGMPNKIMGAKAGEPKSKKAKHANLEAKKKSKEARKWDLSGSNPEDFDFSKKSSDDPSAAKETTNVSSIAKNVASITVAREDIETKLEMTDSETSDDGDDDDEEDVDVARKSGSSYLGSIWKSISYNKALTQEDLKPILEQLQDHLTAKNVASDIAEKLCESVGQKLEGQQVNTWIGLKSFVKKSLEDSVLRILSPNRNINVLREIQTKRSPPYVIVFCGVNGVGKSTNLAKIANWLINNKVRVLVVACDTFRAGAIEQLRTHVQALKSIHELEDSESKIELFERGYGKDSAAIAMEAINYARSNKYNCVMVDTAGRMQDNEPLMRQLAKLIKINAPDLTLFVGEALVGNEAVDQLTKFNNSLLDCGCRAQDSTRSAINGIVLTKFDTIDDQVGAAISMTYVTGQPIVFVGVGQTYKDLKQLDAKAVTRALMR